MKIGIVTQYYPPEPASIPAHLAEGLRDRGHQVRVLTGFPNYPAGELYDGYRQRRRHTETVNGIHVRRAPLYIDHSQNPVKRLVNYLTFGLSAAREWAWLRRCDVIYVYATQLTPAIGPDLWGVPYVLHVQDLWPDSILGSSMVGRAGRVVENVLSPWIRRLYRRAAATIGISPKMRDTLVERGVPEDRAHYVYNWANEGVPQTGQVDIPRRPGVVNIVYAGNFGEMQALDNVMEAARLAGEGFHLYLVGSGTHEAQLRAEAPDNVTFVGRVDPSQMGAVNRQSDFQLVSLKDLPLFEFTIPSKTQNAFAEGIPIIASIPGDVARIVTEQQLGFAAEPENPESLAAAFRSAAALSVEDREMMGNRAQSYYQQQMSQQAGIDRIEAILEAVQKGEK